MRATHLVRGSNSGGHLGGSFRRDENTVRGVLIIVALISTRYDDRAILHSALAIFVLALVCPIINRTTHSPCFARTSLLARTQEKCGAKCLDSDMTRRETLSDFCAF